MMSFAQAPCVSKTTHLEPTHSKADKNKNSLAEEDKELIELLGLQADGINDINDEHNIKGLPRGETFDWSKLAHAPNLILISKH